MGGARRTPHTPLFPVPLFETYPGAEDPAG